MRSCIAIALLMSSSTFAESYRLPKEDSRLVGRVQYHQVEKGETLSGIAKHYHIGFLALMAANKGIDPFLPAEGHALTIPTQIILPDVEREGVVINLAELRLYYFDPDGQTVHIFPVGIGRIGRDTPVMQTSISQKRAKPTWTPPDSIRKSYLAEGIKLPAVVPPGPDNPLGHYALRLAYGAGDYLIHGTNKDFGVGLRVSSGCIRMEPTDIEWLFSKVQIGERVKIINQPIKVTLEPDRSVFIEVHEPLTRSDGIQNALSLPVELSWWFEEFSISDSKARAAVAAQNGLPVEIVPPTINE